MCPAKRLYSLQQTKTMSATQKLRVQYNKLGGTRGPFHSASVTISSLSPIVHVLNSVRGNVNDNFAAAAQ